MVVYYRNGCVIFAGVVVAMIEFESVYSDLEWNMLLLYALLRERTPDQSISHKAMPTMEEHEAFVRSRPYFVWYVIKSDDHKVGAIYLTHQREIGISIKEEHQGNGYATEAIRHLMSICPGEFLANINPQNQASIRLFQKLGFKHIQNTYKLEE